MANFHLFGEVAKTKRNEKDNNKTTKQQNNKERKELQKNNLA